MSGAIFLDRDGVIDRKAPEGEYVESWADFMFLPGAVEALARLTRAGETLIVVTNQRGIARGRMRRAAVDEIHERMAATVAAQGGRIDAVYVCPHDVGTCDCRKPDIGMFRRARDERPWIRFDESVVVGDSLTDLDAGTRLGTRNLLVAAPADEPALLVRARAAGIRVDAVGPSLADLVERGLARTSAAVAEVGGAA